MIPNPADIPPPPPSPAGMPRNAPPASGEAEQRHATQELLRQSIEAKNNAVALLSSVQSVVGTFESAVREQMQARPYVTMGAAAGAGYVLAGGLASSVSRQLLRAGTKAATAFVVGLVLKKVKDAAQAAGDEAKLEPTVAEAD